MAISTTLKQKTKVRVNIMATKQQKYEIARQCLATGKSPIFMDIAGKEDVFISEYQNVNPIDIKKGDRLYINANMRHLDTNIESQHGLVMSAVQQIDVKDGIVTIQSRSTFISNIDFGEEYNDLLKRKLERPKATLKEMAEKLSSDEFKKALAKKCSEDKLRPILITNANFESLVGNHNSSEEYPMPITIDQIEPGMRLYLECKLVDMVSEEILNGTKDICIPGVADVYINGTNIYIETSSGNLITTDSFREQILDITSPDLTQTQDDPVIGDR